MRKKIIEASLVAALFLAASPSDCAANGGRAGDIEIEKPSSAEIVLIMGEITGETLVRPSVPGSIEGGESAAVKMVQGNEVYYLVASETEGGGNFYIFRRLAGALETVFDKRGAEGAVYGYDFADFLGDGTTELVVSYKTGGTIGNAAEIYCLKGGFKSMLAEGFTYNALEIEDMPGAGGKRDGAAEIAVGVRFMGRMSYEVYRLKDGRLAEARDVYPYFFGRLSGEIEKSLAGRSGKNASRTVALCALAEARFLAGDIKRARAALKKAEKSAKTDPGGRSCESLLAETRKLLNGPE